MSRGASFARSWWGKAWISALESNEQVDAERLARGRAYVRQGAVYGVLVEPGLITARVMGSHGRFYDVDIAVHTIPAETWDVIAAHIADRSLHAAALAVGQLDPQIVDDVREAGADLLPRAGDLRARCSCPDWFEVCRHSAAVCYALAGELDRDPAVLFLMRGVSRSHLATMIRIGDRDGVEDGGVAGVVGADAWAGHSLADSPTPMPRGVGGVAPRHPGHPLPWEGRVPVGDPVDPRRVQELAVDATNRAWVMLVDGAISGLSASPRGDIARRGAACDGPRELDALAARCRLTPAAIRAWVEAWQLAGDGGVSVVADQDAWLIDQQRLAAGRDELVEVGIAKRSVALNYDSLGMPGGVKLVLGHDVRWYRLEARSGRRSEPDQFHLVGRPSADIIDLVET